MRNANVLVMASVLAASAPASAAGTPESSQACWQPAFEAGDADAVARCYAPDAVLWLPGAPKTKGRDAIRAAYAGFFAGSRIRSATLTPLGKVVHGDDASSWGTFKVVLVSKKDGKETTETGRYTDVSRRIDGRWQYLVDHASDEPAAPGG
ncbi:MAG: YybH family protein [Luteimonas sp.]